MIREDGLSFETRLFPESEQVVELLGDLPAVRRSLFETGVPAHLFNRYLADLGLSILVPQENVPLVRFGTSGLVQAVGVDVRSGRVLAVLYPELEPTILVNSTIDHFSRTVRALVDRFPYYSRDADWSEIDLACAHLSEAVRSIDEVAGAPGCYWPGFIDDVQMGVFSTEDVLAWWHRRESP